MLQRTYIYFLVTVAALINFGCSANLPSATEIPSSSQISEFSLPRDHSKKRYLVYVSPPTIPAHQVPQLSWGKQISDMRCYQYAGNSALMTYSLMSALGAVGNLTVLDIDARNGTFIRERDELGPFEIRAIITEFNELAEVKESGTSSVTRYNKDESDLAVIGKAILNTPGFWISHLTGLPTEWSNLKVTGVIGLDISIVDPRTSQVLTSFPVHGRFSSKQLEIGNWMQGYHSKDSAGSVMEGAMRVAFHDAAKKIFEELRILKP